MACLVLELSLIKVMQYIQQQNWLEGGAVKLHVAVVPDGVPVPDTGEVGVNGADVDAPPAWVVAGGAVEPPTTGVPDGVPVPDTGEVGVDIADVDAPPGWDVAEGSAVLPSAVVPAVAPVPDTGDVSVNLLYYFG